MIYFAPQFFFLVAALLIAYGVYEWKSTGQPRYPHIWWIAAVILIFLGGHESIYFLYWLPDDLRGLMRRVITTSLSMPATVPILLVLLGLSVRRAWWRYLPALACVAGLCLLVGGCIMSMEYPNLLLEKVVKRQRIYYWLMEFGLLGTTLSIVWHYVSLQIRPLGETKAPPPIRKARSFVETDAKQTAILATHQVLLAVSFGVALHTYEWANTAFPIIIIVNAVVWFAFSRRLTGAASFVAPFKKISPLIAVPALYFAIICLVFTARLGWDLTHILLTFIGFTLAFLMSADLFARAVDLRPFACGIAGTGLMIVIEGGLRLSRVPNAEWLLTGAAYLRSVHLPNGVDPMSYRLGSASLLHPNFVAEQLIIASAAMMGLLFSSKKNPERTVWIVLLILMLTGMYLTGSRFGLIVFVLMGVIYLARLHPLAWIGSASAGSLIMMGVLFITRRSLATLFGADGSLRARYNEWRACLVILKRSPVFGEGPNGFLKEWGGFGMQYGEYARYVDVDGLLPACAADGGLTMIAMAIMLLVGAILQTRKTASLMPDALQAHLLVAIGFGTGFALILDFLNYAFHYYLCMHLLLCIHAGLLVGVNARWQYNPRQKETLY